MVEDRSRSSKQQQQRSSRSSKKKLIVEVVGGVQSIVQSSCTAKQVKREGVGESLPKKGSCWLPKKIEQLLPNIEVVEVVDRRPEVVIGKQQTEVVGKTEVEVVDSSSKEVVEVVDRSRSS